MPRRMSFALTTQQVLDRSKTVTRRHVDRWVNLKPGDRLTAVEKGMGLPKGAKQVVLAEIAVVGARVEPLGLVDADECAAEGFPGHDPGLWRVWWASEHGYGVPAGVNDPDEVLRMVDAIECRRIEFRYLDRCWICPNCGCSFSLPHGRDCENHRPVEVWA